MIDQIKLIAAAVILVLACLATWYTTSEHYQKRINEIQLGMADAVGKELQARADALAAQIDKLKQGEVQHAQDQNTINRLHDQLAGMRIDKICGNTLPGPAQAGTDPNPSARILPGRVDEEFAKLQSRVGQLLDRCDQLNIDAIQLNAAVGK